MKELGGRGPLGPVGPVNDGRPAHGQVTEAESDTRGVFGPGLRALTIGLFLAVTMIGFEALGVSAAMPTVAAELHGSRLYGLAFGAFMLGQLVTIPMAGAAADRRGSRTPYLIGLVTFALGLAIASAAQNMPTLVGARMIAGLGAGAVTVLNLAAIGRSYPERLRSKMFAVISTAWVVPGAIGPTIAGWVTDHSTWRWVFGGLLPLVPFVAMLVAPTLPRAASVAATSTSKSEATKVTKTALRLALATAGVVGGLSVRNPALTLVSVIGGVVLGGPALRHLLPAGTLRLTPGLPAVVGAVSLIMTTFVSAEAFVPRVLHDFRSRSTTIAAVALTGGTLSWTVGSWLQARSPVRWADRRRLVLATFGLGAGVASILAVLWIRVPLWIGYVGWTAGALGMGLAFTSTAEASLRLADPDTVGRVAAATQLAPSLGIAIITAACGRIAADGTIGALRAVYFVMLALIVVTAFAMWRTGLRGRRGERQRRMARATKSVPKAVKIAK